VFPPELIRAFYIIISKNKIAFNTTGNAGMTKGGTGDVLAGLCAGFVAQGVSLWQAAVHACIQHACMLRPPSTPDWPGQRCLTA